MSGLFPKPQPIPPPPEPEKPPPPPQIANAESFVAQRNILQRSMTGNKELRTTAPTANKTLLGQ